MSCNCFISFQRSLRYEPAEILFCFRGNFSGVHRRHNAFAGIPPSQQWAARSSDRDLRVPPHCWSNPQKLPPLSKFFTEEVQVLCSPCPPIHQMTALPPQVVRTVTFGKFSYLSYHALYLGRTYLYFRKGRLSIHSKNHPLLCLPICVDNK